MPLGEVCCSVFHYAKYVKPLQQNCFANRINGGLSVWSFLRRLFVSNRELLRTSHKLKAFRIQRKKKFVSKKLGEMKGGVHELVNLHVGTKKGSCFLWRESFGILSGVVRASSDEGRFRSRPRATFGLGASKVLEEAVWREWALGSACSYFFCEPAALGVFRKGG